MMLVIGMYTAPVISKAGDDVWYGASFDFDGDTYYTDRKSNEYYFDVNESHNMLNWVYEEHYNMTCVRCEGYSVDDYHGAWFGGYWNPDI